MKTYTVEIQAGGYDRVTWMALAPAENVTDNGTAEQVALDVLAEQDLFNAHTDGPWRVVVWSGADADTGTEPEFVIDDQGFRDAQADALDRWQDARVD